MLQALQLLNRVDIPVGIEFAQGQAPPDIPSATQWTSATDMGNRVIYFRTMYDSTIRSIDLNKIDFSRVKYRAVELDPVKQQPVQAIEIQ